MKIEPKVLEKAEELMAFCQKNGLDIVIVLRQESANFVTTKVGYSAGENEFFDCINAAAKQFDSKWGEGALRFHCKQQPQKALPQAIGFGKVYN